MTRDQRRNLVNVIMLSLTGVCTLLSVSVLLFILGYLAFNGASSVNWDFLTKAQKPIGEIGGGLAHAIIGSAMILSIATCIGVPIGLLVGVYLAEFQDKGFPFIVRYVTDLLNGVPSIIIGIFAYTVVVLNTHRYSAWAGGLALGLMMIPIAVRTTEEFLTAVPNSLREGALALGAPKWLAIVTVVIPAASRGLLSGMMLNLARVSGETAPLLFTSFGNQTFNQDPGQPTAALPQMIYNFAVAPYPDWNRQAWAAGFVLLALVLTVNVSAKLIVNRGSSGAK